MTQFLRALCLIALCLVALLCAPATLRAEGRAIIVLDASGSMWDALGGRPKVEIAREALNAVLQALPADVELGLMAYGHREKGNCNDIELIVPPATGRAAAISTAAEFLNFTGKTPLTAAVRQAASALDSENQQATIILITDGVDNCEGDPCALGLELEDTGADFTTHVVGFGLRPDERETVACLAANTGGSYLQADDLAALTQALQRTVLVADPAPTPAPDPAPLPDPQPEPEPEPAPRPQPEPTPPPPLATPNFTPTVLLAAGATPVDANNDIRFTLTPVPADGSPAGPAQVYDGVGSNVPPGRYRMQTRLGPVTAQQDIDIPPSGIAAPDVILNAAAVTLRPRIGPNAAVEATTITKITGPDGFFAEFIGEVSTWLPAGTHTVTATLDAVSTTLPLTIAAGGTVDQDIFISAAVIVPKVFYIPEMPVADATLQIDIVGARPNVDGTRTLVSSRTGRDPVFYLGAGDYVAIAYLGLAQQETPFSIALVQRTELPIILNAGVLSATAPGADHLVIKAPPDIGGNSAPGVRITGDVTLVTMNAGPHILQAAFGDQIVEASFTITPGARTEVALAKP